MQAPLSKVFFEDNIIGLSRYPDKYFHLGIADPSFGIKEDGRKKRNTVIHQKNGTDLHVRKTSDLDQRWDEIPPPHRVF